MKLKQLSNQLVLYLICCLILYLKPYLVMAQLPNSALINSYIRQLEGYGEEYNQAIETLADIGKPAIPALVQALQSGNARSRGAAAIIIAKIGETVPSLALAIFIDTLRHNNYETRFAAVMGLGFMGEKAAPAVPILIQALQEDDKSVRGATVGTICDIGEASKTAIPALVKVLQQDTGDDIRYEIVSCLGNIGKDSTQAINALIIALQDKDYFVRAIAAASLAKVDSDKARFAIPALMAVLKDKKPQVRGNALPTLGIIDKSNPSIKYIALKMLNDENVFVRTQAASTLLLHLRTETKTAFTAIIKDLQGKDDNENIMAALIINKIAEEYKSIVLELSQTELEESIYYFNVSLAILQNPKNHFTLDIIKSVQDCINVLNEEGVKRQLVMPVPQENNYINTTIKLQ